MGDWYLDPKNPGRWVYGETAPTPAPFVSSAPLYPDPGLPSPNANPPAESAGEQDHSNPWFYAGEDANPPEAC